MSAAVFHAGEQALQRAAGSYERLAEIGPNIVRDHMPDQHRELFGKLPTLVVGALDTGGHPVATMLAGRPGFVTTPDARSMAIALPLDRGEDPVLAALTEQGPGAPVGVLGLEPHTRRRNRMNGAVAALTGQDLTLAVVQSFGNCPKYIQAREPVAFHCSSPRPAARTLGPGLDAASRTLIARADTLFIASASARPHSGARAEGVDVSHRGGEPGFVVVVDATPDGLALRMPDYPGNRFFMTLGNLGVDPRAGLLIADYAGGGLLHLRVRARIEALAAADRGRWPGSERVLSLAVEAGLWRPEALPWRWSAPEPAPQFGQMRPLV